MESWIIPLDTEQQAFVDFLHQQGAVLFGDFTLKSGAKSPVFVNVFNAVKNGEGLSRVGRAYARELRHFCTIHELDPTNLFLFGPAYKGIGLAAAVSSSCHDLFGWNTRWGYDRKEAKVIGERTGTIQTSRDEILGMLDGELKNDDQVIIIDDVITRGDAKLEGIEKIRLFAEVKGIKVNLAGILTLVDRVEGAEDLRNQTVVTSVINLPTVAHHLHQHQMISDADYERFMEYFQTHGIDASVYFAKAGVSKKRE